MLSNIYTISNIYIITNIYIISDIYTISNIYIIFNIYIVILDKGLPLFQFRSYSSDRTQMIISATPGDSVGPCQIG